MRLSIFLPYPSITFHLPLFFSLPFAIDSKPTHTFHFIPFWIRNRRSISVDSMEEGEKETKGKERDATLFITIIIITIIVIVGGGGRYALIVRQTYVHVYLLTSFIPIHG